MQREHTTRLDSPQVDGTIKALICRRLLAKSLEARILRSTTAMQLPGVL